MGDMVGVCLDGAGVYVRVCVWDSGSGCICVVCMLHLLGLSTYIMEHCHTNKRSWLVMLFIHMRWRDLYSREMCSTPTVWHQYDLCVFCLGTGIFSKE